MRVKMSFSDIDRNLIVNLYVIKVVKQKKLIKEFPTLF